MHPLRTAAGVQGDIRLLLPVPAWRADHPATVPHLRNNRELLHGRAMRPLSQELAADRGLLPGLPCLGNPANHRVGVRSLPRLAPSPPGGRRVPVVPPPRPPRRESDLPTVPQTSPVAAGQGRAGRVRPPRAPV